MYDIVSEDWCEKFAWLPVRSTWSNRLIWLNRYYTYEYSFTKNNKTFKNKFVYTKGEYLITIMRNEKETY